MEQDKISNYFKINLGLILLFGLLMVFSSSYIYSKETIGTSTYFFSKQIIYAIVGLVVAFLISKSKFDFWIKHAYKIHGVFFLLLVATFLPKIGVSIKGSHRWINLLGFNFQPGEIIKYTTLLCAIRYFEDFEKYLKEEKIKFAFFMFLPLMVLLKQPDFGTFVICVTMISYIAFLSKFPRKYFYSLVALAMSGGIALVFVAPYRVKRVLAFLDPWKDAKGSGFQIIQSYLAFANGSIFGQGIGNSNEKLFYLPESYNDFIFSVIGEELGFVGVVFVALMFLSLIYFGLKLSMQAKEKKVSMVISGVIFCIGLQAYFNMSVVLGLLPTKGLNLPFISYGGSSLICNLCAIGFIFCAKNFTSTKKKEKPSTNTNEE